MTSYQIHQTLIDGLNTFILLRTHLNLMTSFAARVALKLITIAFRSTTDPVEQRIFGDIDEAQTKACCRRVQKSARTRCGADDRIVKGMEGTNGTNVMKGHDAEDKIPAGSMGIIAPCLKFGWILEVVRVRYTACQSEYGLKQKHQQHRRSSRHGGSKVESC